MAEENNGHRLYFYAIARGSRIGIFKAVMGDFNAKLRHYVNGHSRNSYKRFETHLQAMQFMKKHGENKVILYDKNSQRLGTFKLNNNDVVSVHDNRLSLANDDSDLCGSCKLYVGCDDAHPQCDNCHKWYHLQCSNMTAGSLREDDEWSCDACGSLTEEQTDDDMTVGTGVLLQDDQENSSPTGTPAPLQASVMALIDNLTMRMNDLERENSSLKIRVVDLEKQLKSKNNKIVNSLKVVTEASLETLDTNHS